MSAPDTSSISFTAYYTSAVWLRHGLSFPAFATKRAQALYQLGRPIEYLSRVVIGTNNENALLQRHLLIDECLHRAIHEHGVSQIVEIACGLSPRGVRFCQQYPDLHYIEADLPAMAQHKSQLLAEAQLLNEQHRVVAMNILATDGPESLHHVFSQLDPTRPTLVITEGLVNYFDLATIRGFWQRLAQTLTRFPKAAYVTDLYPDFRWHPLVIGIQTFVKSLSVLTRSSVTLHFRDENAIRHAFQSFGFQRCQIHLPESYYRILPIPSQRLPSLVRVIENWL